MSKPAGAAIDQHRNGWSMHEIVGSYEMRLTPLFMLATLTMEAHGTVVPTALPMQLELAHVLSDLQYETEAFLEVVRKGTGGA